VRLGIIIIVIDDPAVAADAVVARHVVQRVVRWQVRVGRGAGLVVLDAVRAVIDAVQRRVRAFGELVRRQLQAACAEEAGVLRHRTFASWRIGAKLGQREDVVGKRQLAA